jgi:hypothetical protein
MHNHTWHELNQLWTVGFVVASDVFSTRDVDQEIMLIDRSIDTEIHEQTNSYIAQTQLEAIGSYGKLDHSAVTQSNDGRPVEYWNENLNGVIYNCTYTEPPRLRAFSGSSDTNHGSLL